jgi:hypothetical protein
VNWFRLGENACLYVNVVVNLWVPLNRIFVEQLNICQLKEAPVPYVFLFIFLDPLIRTEFFSITWPCTISNKLWSAVKSLYLEDGD